MTIIDTGIGIPVEDLPNLFDRFHRGANVVGRSIQGTGLGLHISKGLVEAHHGHIWAESPAVMSGHSKAEGQGANPLGRGSIFHLWLPVRQPGPSELGPTELSASIASRYFEQEEK